MFTLRLNLFHLNLFPFLLPPGRVNTSTSSDSSSAKTPEIYPLPTTATATFLTEACNIPHLDSCSHLLTGLPHSTLATLQSILLQNQFQMLTRLFHILKPSMTFQLLTMKLMVCKAYRAWLLPLPLWLHLPPRSCCNEHFGAFLSELSPCHTLDSCSDHVPFISSTRTRPIASWPGPKLPLSFTQHIPAHPVVLAQLLLYRDASSNHPRVRLGSPHTCTHGPLYFLLQSPHHVNFHCLLVRMGRGKTGPM